MINSKVFCTFLNAMNLPIFLNGISCCSSYDVKAYMLYYMLQAEILHLYASTILYSSIFFSVNFLISLLVSPFILGELFNIKVFITVSFRIL